MLLTGMSHASTDGIVRYIDSMEYHPVASETERHRAEG